MILSTLFTAIALTGAPQTITDQSMFSQQGKKIRINVSAPVNVFGKKIRINGDMTDFGLVRMGKKIRIDFNANSTITKKYGKKIRINLNGTNTEVINNDTKISI